MIVKAIGQDEQEKRIQATRELLQPTPVDLHHIPNWFRLALLRAYACSHFGTSAWAMLEWAQQKMTTNRWLDHYGSTVWQGQQCFVSEPYGLSVEDVQTIAKLAGDIGCRWLISANSWWNPPATIRVVFYQSEDRTA